MKHSKRPIMQIRRAFTLIELLVVIALTSILIVLVFKPITDSFALTSRAGTQIESQTASREVLREITTELSNAAFIYDNGRPESRINIWANEVDEVNGRPASGAPLLYPTQYAMVEYIAPAQQGEQSLTTGGYTDPTTGLPLRNGNTPGQRGFALPLGPGSLVTRVFLGLRDNRSVPDNRANPDGGKQSGMPAAAATGAAIYASRWDDAATITPAQDNRYTLYKATFRPFIKNPNGNGYVVNVGLFHTRNDDGTVGSDPNKPIILDDPNFYYDATTVPAGYGLPGVIGTGAGGAVTIADNWKAVAQTMLPTYKADAIGVSRDTNNRIIPFIGGVAQVDDQGNVKPRAQWATGQARPQIRPLIAFTPANIVNEQGVASNLENTSAESPITAGPSFSTQYGAWSNPFTVTLYRAAGITDDPVANPANTYIYSSTNTDGRIALNNPTGTDVGPKALTDPATGAVYFTNKTAAMLYAVDVKRGLVNFSFPQSVYLYGANHAPLASYHSANMINGGIFFDPTIFGPNFDPTATTTIGRRHLWLGFVDKTIYGTNGIPAIDGQADSPITLFYQAPTTTQFATVRITPGSERVYGPDQLPGSHYGQRILFTRVAANAGAIGPNEYKINYEPVKNAENASLPNDPRLQTGYIEFDSQPDGSDDYVNMVSTQGPNDPASVVEDPSGQDHGGISVYRPHSLPTLTRDLNTGANAPAAPIEVYYNFQVNRPNDVVKVDYQTRQLINVTMEMKLYDPSSSSPQITQVASKITVRNLQR